MALAGRKRPRIIMLPTRDVSDPAHPPATTIPFSVTRKLRTMKKQDVFLIDVTKGTAVPATGAPAGSTGIPTSAHLSGTEISIQPVSRLETRKAMAKAGLLTTSDVVDMSALATKLEKRAAALTTPTPTRKPWQLK